VGTIVSGTISVPSSTIQAFGYDPLNDSVFTVNASGNALSLISNVDTSPTPQVQVTNGEWLKFEKGGNLGNGGGGPLPGSMLLNPDPIPSLGLTTSYSTAIIMDGALVVTTPAQAPGLTQKMYRYNLQQDTSGDANNEFTSMITLDKLQTAAGQASTVTTTNLFRQPAWSGDGQSLYFTDTSAAFGGLWTQSAGGGSPTRLLATSADINTEPAVLSTGGTDTIYFRGGGTTNNQGGLDKITYDGTTASARTIAVKASTINDFLELSTGSIQCASMCSDAAGNLYFNDGAGARAGSIFCLDPQGRMYVVVSALERSDEFGGTRNSNTLRMQPRTTSYTSPVAGVGSFNVTQILYEDLGVSGAATNIIAGADVFRPGDFNRDNRLDQTDVAEFQAALTPKGIPASASNLKFDMNGNGEVSYKDVKIFQSFDGFADGDANMDGTVNALDFNAMANGYSGTSDTWLQGDFTGDNTVDSADFAILASNYGIVTPPPVNPPAGAATPFGQLGDIVPEPGAIAGLAIASLLLRRNRLRKSL
jgi:hypothetical protein